MFENSFQILSINLRSVVLVIRGERVVDPCVLLWSKNQINSEVKPLTKAQMTKRIFVAKHLYWYWFVISPFIYIRDPEWDVFISEPGGQILNLSTLTPTLCA